MKPIFFAALLAVTFGCAKSEYLDPAPMGGPGYVPGDTKQENRPAMTDTPAAPPVEMRPESQALRVPSVPMIMEDPTPKKAELSDEDCQDPLMESIIKGRSAVAVSSWLGLLGGTDLISETIDELKKAFDKEYYFIQVCRYRLSVHAPKGLSTFVLAINPQGQKPGTLTERFADTADALHAGSLDYVSPGQLGQGSSIQAIPRNLVQTLGGFWDEGIQFSVAMVHKPSPHEEVARVIWMSGPNSFSYHDLKENEVRRLRIAWKDDKGVEDGTIVLHLWKGESRELYSTMAGKPKPKEPNSFFGQKHWW